MIHLVLDDTEAGRATAHALELLGIAKVVEGDSSLQLASVDERMKKTLECLKQEGTLVHGYDYVWIMRYLNEEHLKKTGLFFCSVRSYRDYVMLYMSNTTIAGVSTMSYYYSCGEGRFPEWTFTDTNDATERLRRINVARRFAVIFTRQLLA
jgi:hypothetical protein